MASGYLQACILEWQSITEVILIYLVYIQSNKTGLFVSLKSACTFMHVFALQMVYIN